ncbi:hypothetical protein PCPL58_3432 [Pseudomonas cerasi]|uniref:Uncharacterized protein n=1 Tax=Pseudomonas cerasi TaxID=1583341 RepID=A0A193SST3_9PSED|nr:hypothetical protein PCPL58_3432 [Pseudomonas cerasi]SOS21609.1 hypothetical protein PL963_03519 [Pseudomonas cerasi]
MPFSFKVLGIRLPLGRGMTDDTITPEYFARRLLNAGVVRSGVGDELL